MNNILDKCFTLKLNKYWKAVGNPSVYDVIIAMCRLPTSENGNSRPYFALDIDYPNINWPPLEWDNWINLPIRPQDNYIQAAKRKIRVPTVIIANNYAKIPKRPIRFSKRAVRERDGNRCQYTGEYVTQETGDLDHFVPLDLGGQTTFENTTTALKKVNRLKANMHPDEFLKRFPEYKRPNPFRPKASPIIITNIYDIQDWNLFLNKT